MRHTFASLLVSAGESIYKVAVWLGDEVSTVQKHYGHLTPDNHGIEKAFSMRKVHD
jgi:site-specific recombinase XerD